MVRFLILGPKVRDDDMLLARVATNEDYGEVESREL